MNIPQDWHVYDFFTVQSVKKYVLLFFEKSTFLSLEAIHSWDNTLPFGLQIPLSWRISDLLISSEGISVFQRAFFSIKTLCLSQKLMKALSSSISLSHVDKTNRGKTQRECHKCQTVHTEAQSRVDTQCCIVLWGLYAVTGKCTLQRKLSAFLLTSRDAAAWHQNNR